MRAIAVAVAAALAVAAPVLAEDDVDSDVKEQARTVIQNRKFRLGSELTLGVATLPIDPFHKGIAGTARFTFHFNDFHAWEVAGGSYAYNLDTSLTEQLLKNFGVQRAQLPGIALTLLILFAAIAIPCPEPQISIPRWAPVILRATFTA